MTFFLKSISTHLNRWLQPQLIRSVILIKFLKSSLYLAAMATIIACQSQSVSFNSFDTKQWISESRNCNNYRISVIEEMKSEFDQLLGMSEKELIGILGKPEETHLYTRGQKFFSYSLTCGDSVVDTRRLRIRFSALDQVNEVIVLD